MERARARLATHLLRLTRRLLAIGPSDGDFDTCVHCRATGCEDGTSEHRPDCPAVTGLHTVAPRDLWPDGPAICDRCDTTLWPGDSYMHVRLDDHEGIAVYEVTGVGCAALAAVA